MQLILDIQNTIDKSQLPAVEQLKVWLKAALAAAEYKPESAEISLRIVSVQESQQLNDEYRGKNKPTNILSFPFEAPPQVPLDLLGDLVICESVVIDEAKQQQKSLADHWAHMLIHGVLHLLGFDHIEEQDATVMENLEIRILSEFGIANPYI